MKWIFFSVLALAGCYAPHPPNGAIACSAGGACPLGYRCSAVDNRCYTPGHEPAPSDLAVEDLAMVDSATTDAAERSDGGLTDAAPADLRPDGACNQPCVAPPGSCGDGGLFRTTTDPTCDVNGDCVFTRSADSCSGAPAPTCTGGIEIDYAPSGSCGADGGTAACEYLGVAKSCPSGCAGTGDVCAGDPCAGNHCAAQTPDSSCNGLTFTQYTPNTCNGASGSAVCVPHQTVSDCSGANPCVSYGCSTASGCTTSNKANYVSSCSSPANGFCFNGACTARVVTVMVTPPAANLHAGTSQSFTGASSSNDAADSTAVTWSLNPAAPASGALTAATTSSVVYTAPASVPTPATVGVVATSAVDSGKSSSATITVYPAIAVSALTLGNSTPHAGKTTSVSATLSNLAPGDTGNGVFTATHGTLSGGSCTKSGASSTCTATYTAGAAGADSITLTSSDQSSSSNSVSLTVYATIVVSAADASAHISKTVTLTATLSNLAPGDSGNAGYAASSGSFGTVSCTKSGGSSTCSAVYSAPATVGSATITITSSDDNSSKATATITVVPLVTLALDKSSVDLLAFGTPAQTAVVTATLGNLLPGDSSAVTATPNSVNAVTGSLSGTALTITPTSTYNFAASTSAPPVTTFTFAASANPSATAALTVNLHAWIDESATLGSKFSTGVGFTSVAVNKLGDVMVGGTDGSSPAQPRLAYRNHANGVWSALWQPASNGAVTHITAADDDSFLVTGLLGNADGNGNQPVLVQHWTNPPGSVPGNLAPSGAVAASDIGKPRIVSWTGFKYLSYSAKGVSGCGSGTKGKATVLYNPTNSLDAAFSAGNQYTFGSEVPSGAATGNSCPFTPYETSNMITGFTINNALQLWIGGYADCGLKDGSGNGCTSSADGSGGLAASTIGTPSWRSSWSALLAAHVAAPVLRRGYDDSLLAVATQNNCNVFYYLSGNPAVTSGTVVLANSATDIGTAIAGSASGGAPWAGALRDLFVLHIDFLTPAISWVLGNSEQVVATPAGVYPNDVIVVHDNAAYEGWMVGVHLSGSFVVTGPMAVHLF